MSGDHAKHRGTCLPRFGGPPPNGSEALQCVIHYRFQHTLHNHNLFMGLHLIPERQSIYLTLCKHIEMCATLCTALLPAWWGLDWVLARNDRLSRRSCPKQAPTKPEEDIPLTILHLKRGSR
jgi:hypothetical protein